MVWLQDIQSVWKENTKKLGMTHDIFPVLNIQTCF